jgi:hypothetical protein
MASEQDAADITVYDLAERMARGQPLTDAAHREVATELLALRAKYDELLKRVENK